MAEKPLFDIGPSRQVKQIALIAGIGLAALAVYEFSSNAGQQAGAGIGEGIGSAATTLGIGAAVALVIFVML